MHRSLDTNRRFIAFLCNNQMNDHAKKMKIPPKLAFLPTIHLPKICLRSKDIVKPSSTTTFLVHQRFQRKIQNFRDQTKILEIRDQTCRCSTMFPRKISRSPSVRGVHAELFSLRCERRSEIKSGIVARRMSIKRLHRLSMAA